MASDRHVADKNAAILDRRIRPDGYTSTWTDLGVTPNVTLLAQNERRRLGNNDVRAFTDHATRTIPKTAGNLEVGADTNDQAAMA